MIATIERPPFARLSSSLDQQLAALSQTANDIIAQPESLTSREQRRVAQLDTIAIVYLRDLLESIGGAAAPAQADAAVQAHMQRLAHEMERLQQLLHQVMARSIERARRPRRESSAATPAEEQTWRHVVAVRAICVAIKRELGLLPPSIARPHQCVVVRTINSGVDLIKRVQDFATGSATH